jgi:hypothetical protein
MWGNTNKQGNGEAYHIVVDTDGRLLISGAAAEDAAVDGAPVLIGGRYDATLRSLDDGDAGALALSLSGDVHVRQENREVTALSSAERTGDTQSSDLTNYGWAGIAILLDVTAVDSGQIDAITVQAKVGSSYVDIYSFSSLTINSTGQSAFLIHPGAVDAGSWTAAPLQGVIPRNWRLSVDHANETDGITYSITVCYLV